MDQCRVVGPRGLCRPLDEKQRSAPRTGRKGGICQAGAPDPFGKFFPRPPKLSQKCVFSAFFTRRAGILFLVHFMKENYLEKPCGSWNPYPSAFYEGELPGEALWELESLS